MGRELHHIMDGIHLEKHQKHAYAVNDERASSSSSSGFFGTLKIFPKKEKPTSRSSFSDTFTQMLLITSKTLIGLLELKSNELTSSVATCTDYIKTNLPDYNVAQTTPEVSNVIATKNVLVVGVRAWTEASTKWARKMAEDGVHLLLLFAQGVKVPSDLDKLANLRGSTQALKDNLRPDLALHRFFSVADPPGTEETLKKATRMANTGLAKLENGKITCVFCEWTGINDADHCKRISPECPAWSNQGPPGDILQPDLCRNYRIEAHRLLSFWRSPKKWMAPVSYKDLAANGFYFVGPDDNVRCGFCALEVRGWEPNDTADAEHKRWNPRCAFLNSRTTVGNIPLGQEQVSTFTDSVCSKSPLKYQQYGPHVKFFKSPALYGNRTGIMPAESAKHKNMVNQEARFATFREWPRALAQQPQELVEGGFFYTGVGDRVCCYWCGVGLKDWAPNDKPKEEHEKWSPACPFLSLPQSEQMEISASESGATGRGCFKCGSHQVDAVSLPCGHMARCFECRSEPEPCDICSTEVIGAVRTFV